MVNIVEILNPADQQQASALCGYCFNDTVGWTERIWPLFNGDRGWGVFEEGRLQSFMLDRNFRAGIFGSLEKISGIACVASRPEARNGGLARRVLTDILQKARAAGKVAAALYPFKFGFYEKMGFGYLGGTAFCSFDPARLHRMPKPAGRFRPASGDPAEVAAIFDLFDRWVQQYSFGILYPRLPGKTFLEDSRLFKLADYLYYREGRCCGYIRYKITDQAGGGRKMSIREVAWEDREALEAFFQFLAAHRDQCSEIEWRKPRSFPLDLFLPEPRFQHKLHSDYMGRPLAIEHLLARKAAVQPPTGEFTFSLQDEELPENTASYRIAGGKVKKESYRDEHTLPLPLFASLLFGAVSWQEAELRSLVPALPEAAAFFRKDHNIFLGVDF